MVEKNKLPHEKPSPFVHILSGAGAGSTAAIVTCPLDVIKTKMQNEYIRDSTRTWSPTKVLKYTWKYEGIRGFYRGLGPSLMGLLPNWAIYFCCYESFQPHVSNLFNWPLQSVFVHLSSAIGAGLCSAVATNPLWVLKVRLMTQNFNSEIQYKNTFDCFQKIVKYEGVFGLYKGLGSSMLGVIHVGIQFPLYERLKLLTITKKNILEEELTATELMFLASISKAVASIAWYPHEVIRTRLQNQVVIPPKYLGIIHAFQTIFREEGPKAFYSGMSANLIRSVPAGAITFTVYEILSRNLSASL